MIKKAIKYLAIIILFIILGGIAGVAGERIVFPWLSSFKYFSSMPLFQKANEKVTVINKTEQITVKEDYTVSKTAQSVLPSVVSIISYIEPKSENVQINIGASNEIGLKIKTGIIFTNDGLVVSMLKDPQEMELLEQQKYKILIFDGREFDAEFVDYDIYSNLVFYRIDTMNLPAPPLGDSNAVESGEKVILIGNSGGEYQNTFATGLIQEKDHTFTLLNSELSISEKMEGAIVTDGQINPENIGGPVVDFDGNIVGISAMVQKNGQEIGFVVPINDIKKSFDKIIKDGKIERPVLGAYYLSINREISLLNNLPVNRGALVYSFSGQRGLAVIKNSPADIFGLNVGDIVTKVGGKEVTLENSLADLIAEYSKGEKVVLTLLRAGKEQEIEVALQ